MKRRSGGRRTLSPLCLPLDFVYVWVEVSSLSLSRSLYLSPPSLEFELSIRFETLSLSALLLEFLWVSFWISAPSPELDLLISLEAPLSSLAGWTFLVSSWISILSPASLSLASSLSEKKLFFCFESLSLSPTLSRNSLSLLLLFILAVLEHRSFGVVVALSPSSWRKWRGLASEVLRSVMFESRGLTILMSEGSGLESNGEEKWGSGSIEGELRVFESDRLRARFWCIKRWKERTRRRSEFKFDWSFKFLLFFSAGGSSMGISWGRILDNAAILLGTFVCTFLRLMLDDYGEVHKRAWLMDWWAVLGCLAGEVFFLSLGEVSWSAALPAPLDHGLIAMKSCGVFGEMGRKRRSEQVSFVWVSCRPHSWSARHFRAELYCMSQWRLLGTKGKKGSSVLAFDVGFRPSSFGLFSSLAAIWSLAWRGGACCYVLRLLRGLAEGAAWAPDRFGCFVFDCSLFLLEGAGTTDKCIRNIKQKGKQRKEIGQSK